MIDPTFKFYNAIPKQTQKWSVEDQNTAWTGYVNGESHLTIARKMGRTEKAIERFVENVLDYASAHPTVKFQGNRMGYQYSPRDSWILERACERHLPKKRIAELMGRSEHDFPWLEH